MGQLMSDLVDDLKYVMWKVFEMSGFLNSSKQHLPKNIAERRLSLKWTLSQILLELIKLYRASKRGKKMRWEEQLYFKAVAFELCVLPKNLVRFQLI